MPEEIIWEPTEKQGGFLACDDFEVLYGGAAGGGKSDALLIDALCLQHDGINNPRHRAILFRRSFPELRDLIGRSLELYPLIVPGAKYNKTEKVWSLPSGATVEFGYLQHDDDRLQYRGRAWNYIGFDELTLWATPICYLYLFSRCRSADKTLPRYIRATTNPDGPGQKWVMERWGIQRDGGETDIPVDIVDEDAGIITTIRRRFIPAKLSDNKHLAGTGYREALLQMSPDERDSLLKGLWTGNKIKGAYYVNEMQRLRAEGRIRSVPHTAGVPVYTFWDLGMNDTTAIWFMQVVAGETRFIRAYENSGESLEHYAQYLQKQSYTYATHFLPHDAANRSLQTGKSSEEMLIGMLPGHRFEIVRRVESVIFGIQQTRMAMGGNIYIDETNCGDGIVALDSYQKKYNSTHDVFTEEPLHNRYSNYADAFRQWAQGFQPATITKSRRSAPHWAA